MIEPLLKPHRFHASNRTVYFGKEVIADCADIAIAAQLQAALNQLDDICVYAKIPRPLPCLKYRNGGAS